MKAFISIKHREDNSNRDSIQKISSALERNGFETVCVARDIENWGQFEFSPADLMQGSFAAIESSDVFVVDLSEKGVGLGIEAGYAFAAKIPVVVIAKAGSDISTTLKGISQNLFLYETFEDLVQFFEVLKIPHVQQ